MPVYNSGRGVLVGGGSLPVAEDGRGGDVVSAR